jgi:hypothetical protein
MRKLAIAGLLAAGAVGLAGPAWGHGGPPETFTDVVKDATETFPEVNPCTGDPGEVTLTYNGVFHVTVFADGHFHVTGTSTGTFAFDTADPALPDYSGRFTTWFGANGNPNSENGTETFRLRGTGTDGSTLKFNSTAHLTVVGSDVIVEFDKFRCG